MGSLLDDFQEHVQTNFKLILRDAKKIECIDIHRDILIASSTFFRTNLHGQNYYAMTLQVSDIEVTKEILAWMYLRNKKKLIQSIKMDRMIHFLGVEANTFYVPKHKQTRKMYNTRSSRMQLRSGFAK